MEMRGLCREDLPWLEKLYKSAFPEDERMPFRMMVRDNGRRNEIHVYTADGEPVGFTVIYSRRDPVYLAYLAVDETHRHEGIGSEIMRRLMAYCSDRVIAADIEECIPGAENEAERLARRQFYLNLGFTDPGIRYHFFGVDYEVVCCHGTVDRDAFAACVPWAGWAGHLMRFRS